MRSAAPRLLACLALAAATLAFPGRGDSFLQMTSGSQVSYWANPPVAYVININGSADISGTADDDAVRAGFMNWQNVSTCSLAFSENTTLSQRQRTDFQANDIHLCIWDETNWSGYFPPGTSTIGITPSEFSWGGQISDSDILFNGSDYTWSTTGANNTIDVESVTTHEAGHFCGLDHTAIYTGTMYPVTLDNVTRTPSSDDVAGISTTYPDTNYDSTYGSLTGTLTLPTGTACRGAHVTAIAETSDGTGSGAAIASTFTNTSGVFTIKGLVPGTYAILAEPLNGPAYSSSFGLNAVDTNWGATYYGTDNQNMSLFQVTAGQTASVGAKQVLAAAPFNATSLFPVKATQGQTLTIYISGNSLSSASSVNITGAGITVNSASLNGGQIQMNITVAASAPLGMRTVTVLNSTNAMTNIVGGLDILTPGGQPMPYPSNAPPPPPPVLNISTASLPGGTVGAAYSQTVSATGGTTPYAWTISSGSLPAGLTLNPSTGAIAGTPTAAGTSNFTVSVSDSAQPPASDAQALSIVVAAAPSNLSVSTSSLPAGTVGASYYQFLSANGGTPGYTWSIVSGLLPPGLSLNGSTGAVAGTPTIAGTSNFTVMVTDSTGASATKALSIVVNPAPNAPNITTTSMPTGTVGTPYNTTLAATGGAPPYAWSLNSGVIPPGLSLNSSTGAIGGTPTSAGSYAVQWKVTDSTGAIDTQNSPWTIQASSQPPPAPTVTGVTPNSGAYTGATNLTLTGTGFSGATGVSLLTSPSPTSLTNVSVVSATQITATVPAGAMPGSYQIRVTGPNGSNSTSPLFAVTEGLPTVASITPNQGPNSATTNVTIAGTNFLGVNTSTGVRLTDAASTALTNVVVVNATQITGRVPAGVAPGLYNVRVTNTAGNSGNNTVAFQVGETLPGVSSIAPSSGANSVATPVTISGQNFASATSARLMPANLLLTGFSVQSSTQITATVPAGATPGAYTVVVTNSGGQNATGPSFTVTGPPTANAGPDQTLNPTIVTLSGAGSGGTGGTFTYAWTRSGGTGPSVTLTPSATAASPRFTAQAAGTYAFSLTVTSGGVASTPDSVTITISNVAPVANAGPDQSIATGTTLVLDGTASKDANGSNLTYSWAADGANPAGGSLSSGTSATPTFTPGASGLYVYRLTVSDGSLTSAADPVQIMVSSPTVVAPSADAGVDQVVAFGSPAPTVALTGHESVDPDSQTALTFTWTKITGPAIASPTPAGLNAKVVTFQPTTSGVYVFRLVTRDTADDNLNSAADTVKVIVLSPNTPPVAIPAISGTTDSNGNGMLDAGDSVTLSGGGSLDPDSGATLTYTWTQTGGAPYALSGASTVTAAFTPLSGGTFTFELTVSDGTDTSFPAEVVVQVLPSGAASTAAAPVAHARVNGLPVARASAIPNTTTITLSGVTSEDHDGVAAGLTYDWSQVSGPTVPISGSTAATATFVPRVSRVYRFRLTVRDGNGLLDDDFVTVIVDTWHATLNPTGNNVPESTISGPGSGATGSTLTLDGSGSSDSALDPDGVSGPGDGLLYFWWQSGGPYMPLSGANSPTLSFNPTRPGTYEFKLIVDDGADHGWESTSTVTVASNTSENASGPDTFLPATESAYYGADSESPSASSGSSGGGGGGGCFADVVAVRRGSDAGPDGVRRGSDAFGAQSAIILLLLGLALSLQRRDR